MSLHGDVQLRGGLTVGESLVVVVIGRAGGPPSKRDFSAWVRTTYLPELMNFVAADLSDRCFLDQLNAVPQDKLAATELRLVREVVRTEKLARGGGSAQPTALRGVHQSLEGADRDIEEAPGAPANSGSLTV